MDSPNFSPAGPLARVIAFNGVGEKDGCATANQKRNNNCHERYSCDKAVKYRLRE
jgi:hypothetical protein